MLIAMLVFFSVFAIVALLSIALAPSKASRQTEATLSAAIRSPLTFHGEEQLVDVRKAHLMSSIPWVHAVLSHMNVALELRNMINQAGLTWTPGRLMLTCVSSWVIAGYLISLRTGSPAMGALLGALAGAAPIFYVWRMRQRRLTKILSNLPDALDVMVSALRAGQSMGSAFSSAARDAGEPIGRELRLCAEEQNFGIDLRTALENLLARVPLPDVRLVATALLIHKESGGNLAEVLDKTAMVIRERFQVLQQIRVQTAQGRLTGWVLSLLPICLGMILYIISPDYIAVLLDHSVGHKIMAIGLVMNIAGLFMIRRIVNIQI